MKEVNAYQELLYICKILFENANITEGDIKSLTANSESRTVSIELKGIPSDELTEGIVHEINSARPAYICSVFENTVSVYIGTGVQEESD